MGSSRRSAGGLRAHASSRTRRAATLTRSRLKAVHSPCNIYFDFLLATQAQSP